MTSMTIKQIADLAGVSKDSIERMVRYLYPLLMSPRKTTILDYAQSVAVMERVRKANMVSLPQNAAAVPQNAAAVPQNAADAYTARDIEMILLGFERCLQRAHSAIPIDAPPHKALPHYQERRVPLSQMEAAARIEMAHYPLKLRQVALMLNVDPQIALRHSDLCGLPRTGRQDRALFLEDVRKMSESIYSARAARKNRKS